MKTKMSSYDLRMEVDDKINELYGSVAEQERVKLLQDYIDKFKQTWKQLYYIPDGAFKLSHFEEIDNLVEALADKIYDVYVRNVNTEINLAKMYKEAIYANGNFLILDDKDTEDFINDLFNHTLECALKENTYEVRTVAYFNRYKSRENDKAPIQVSSYEVFNEALNNLVSDMKKGNGLAEKLIGEMLEYVSSNIIDKDFIADMYEVQNYGFDSIDEIIDNINFVLAYIEKIKSNKDMIDEYLKEDVLTARAEALRVGVTSKTLLKSLMKNNIFECYEEENEVINNLFKLDNGDVVFGNLEEKNAFVNLIDLADRAEKELGTAKGRE